MPVTTYTLPSGATVHTDGIHRPVPAEPFDPYSDNAQRWGVRAMRRYCWCEALLEMGGDEGPRFATCSYCWASRGEDQEDSRAHRAWYGHRWPGDHLPVQNTDVCDHGHHEPHHQCGGLTLR